MKNLARFPAENPNPVLRVSKTGTLHYANPATRSILRYWKIKIGDVIPESLQTTLRQAFLKKTNKLIEVDINKQIYEFIFVPIAKVNYANIYARNITSRKQAELALRRSEAQLRTLYSTMTDGLAYHEVIYQDNQAVDYKILDINPAYEQITGLSKKQVIGKKASRIYGTGNPPYLDIYAQVALSGVPKTFVTYFPPMQKHFSISVFSPSQGKFATLFADITERKKKEDELFKLNRTLKALGRSSQAMMHALNETDYLNEVCRIVVQDCGYAMVWIGFAEADAGKTVRPVAFSGFEVGYLETLKITWADTERGQGPTGTAIRTGQPSMCRNMLTDPRFLPWRPEALKRGYASSLVLPLIRGDKTFGAITIYSKEPDAFTESDVKLLTELAEDLAYGIENIRLRAEQAYAAAILKRDKATVEQLAREKSAELINAQLELERAKRLSDIGLLAATVAHELRNPLAAITMAASNIKRKAQNPALEKNLSTIANKIAESDQIINNLLFYSKLRPPRLEKTYLSNIIADCVETLEKQHPHSIKIEQSLLPIQDILLSIDPLQIREVFSNLLDNAVDALEGKPGQIKISAQVSPKLVRVFVKDNGQGINPEDLENVFSPFFTTKAKGTGLGLTICSQIIKLHGGKLEIESKIKQGTTLIIYLPKNI